MMAQGFNPRSEVLLFNLTDIISENICLELSDRSETWRGDDAVVKFQSDSQFQDSIALKPPIR